LSFNLEFPVVFSSFLSAKEGRHAASRASNLYRVEQRYGRCDKQASTSEGAFLPSPSSPTRRLPSKLSATSPIPPAMSQQHSVTRQASAQLLHVLTAFSSSISLASGGRQNAMRGVGEELKEMLGELSESSYSVRSTLPRSFPALRADLPLHSFIPSTRTSTISSNLSSTLLFISPVPSPSTMPFPSFPASPAPPNSSLPHLPPSHLPYSSPPSSSFESFSSLKPKRTPAFARRRTSPAPVPPARSTSPPVPSSPPKLTSRRRDSLYGSPTRSNRAAKRS
jgi:hypothetical protein